MSDLTSMIRFLGDRYAPTQASPSPTSYLLNSQNTTTTPSQKYMADKAQLARVDYILNKNTDKNFVKRIISPDNYPKLKQSDGTFATHKMGWGEANGKYVVYPEVVQGKDGRMIDLKEEGIDPWKYAKDNNEYIEFNTPEEADWFSQRYKTKWGL